MSIRSGVLAVVVLLAATAFRPVDENPTVSFNGYAEWRKGDALVIDGQRVRWSPKGKFKGTRDAQDFTMVPLGYEAAGKGTRQADGSILAVQMEVKPNGSALFENDVKKATADMEQKWLKAGHIVEPAADGKEKDGGRLHTSGRDVDRVRGVVTRLVPPYLEPASFRTYVVENKDWNAFACANGMIVVNDSLLHDTNDDELAVVLGHELTHATHEHSRKEFKNTMLVELIAVGAVGGAAASDSKKTAAVVGLASMFTLMAYKNGYSRGAEDQADRVGLRYVYEAGYDVHQGPELWGRFAKKYGDQNQAVNFFFGNHSVASARQKNLEREIAINYSAR
jgi:Zn-dependent protease with chaperone function